MTEQPRCQATRKDGAPCGSFALPGRPWCFAHDPERTQERQAARAKGSLRAGQMRKLRGKRARLDTVPGLVRFVAQVIQDALDGTIDVGAARMALYGASIQKQLLETSDLERRIATLEQRLVGRASGPTDGSKHNGDDARHTNSESGEAGAAL